MAALKVLAVAVASGRAGYVCLDGTTLRDWGITVNAVKSTTEIAGFVQTLVNELKPDVIVTERCDEHCRKGKKAKTLIKSVAEIASHNYVLDVSVARPRNFQSKYEEAEDLVQRHPDLMGYLPKGKRRIFDFEPRGMILFEAMALAEEVLHGPPTQFAAAMG
ncbi:hypothetical protein [Falsiphaeobacter marinintestinus]|uniref:hypothetical protein n=1 Tax=Falsiphaeobacter marinintestinus TaxID=1492905 RepID=UPI0011B85630|nr:hypothetical protein [Phaeobacter marinintestinus]